ncbi:MAG: hypothetical protein ACSHXZ_04745 [Gammaproteobacteria bacterium]
MSNKTVPNATVSAFVMGMELTDRFPLLPLSAQEVKSPGRSEPHFLLQSLRNLCVKKCGRRSGGRSSFK